MYDDVGRTNCYADENHGFVFLGKDGFFFVFSLSCAVLAQRERPWSVVLFKLQRFLLLGRKENKIKSYKLFNGCHYDGLGENL
jgi:hypothetical protein